MSLPYPVPDDDLLRSAPDLFSRHYRVYAAIEQIRTEGARFTILDVGGRAGLTKRFFPDDDVTIVDIRSDQDDVVEVAPGDSLPFSDESFDFVVSFDVLEHVEPQHRSKWLAEVVRTAAHASFVTVPDENAEALAAERRANDLYRDIAGEPHPWLQEHEDFGIPERAEIAAALDATGATWRRYASNPVDDWLSTIEIGFVRDFARDILPDPDSVTEVNRQFFGSDGAEPGYRAIYVATTQDQSRVDLLQIPASSRPKRAAFDLGLLDLHRIERQLRLERDRAQAEANQTRIEIGALASARTELESGRAALQAAIQSLQDDNAQLQHATQELRATLADRQAQLDVIHSTLWYRLASRLRGERAAKPS